MLRFSANSRSTKPVAIGMHVEWIDGFNLKTMRDPLEPVAI
jgi:hypothetical protein